MKEMIAEGRAPWSLIVIVGLMLAGTALYVQPYSVTSPWHAYDQPARLFLRAAARGDSLSLNRRTSGTDAARWALAAARAHPDSFAVWAKQAKAWAGTQQGDSTDIFLSTTSYSCNLVLRFVGPEHSAKIERASSECLGPR
jgi:hypothetical protein